MRKLSKFACWLVAIIAYLLLAVAMPARAALDASQATYVEILPAQASLLEKTDLLLLGPVSNTNGDSTAGSAIDVSAYEGKAIVINGLSARSGASHTSTVSVVYGFDESPATALVTSTQTTATALFDSYEFDFDTLQGTNAALYLKATFANVAGDSNAMLGASCLVYDAARSAAQSITGTGVDVSAYKGGGAFVVQCGGAVNESTNYTATVTLQHSASLASGYTTITNVAGTAGVLTLTGTTGSVQEYAVDMAGLHKYVRAVVSQTNDVGSVGVTLAVP